jgi:hypothetical protein
MRLARLAIVGILAGGLVAAAPGSASADDLRYVTSTKKVVVNQSYENVAWHLAGTDVSRVDSVDATLEHVATREVADFDFAYDGETSGTFRFYDFDRYGTYTVYGEVYDYDYNEMSAAATTLVIKAASKSPLTASRSGAYVTLRTTTKKYDGGYPRWKNHRNAVVRFQRKTSGGWTTIARRTVPANGVTSARFRRPAPATYRVSVAEASKVWASQSGTVRR